MINILLLYWYDFSFQLRGMLLDHLNSFAQHPDCRVFYVNTAFPFPPDLHRVNFDLIIFHTTISGRLRWREEPYDYATRNFEVTKYIDATRITIPQDEFIYCDHVSRMINDHKIQIIFTCAPENEWAKIYFDVYDPHVKYFQVLTGYLTPSLTSQLDKHHRVYRGIHRFIDIGYRASPAKYWLGWHGTLKEQIATETEKLAKKKNFIADISISPNKIFFGYDWIHFLLHCKSVIGVEGGSSLLDHDGAIRLKVYQYLQKNPNASFEETENACFPGLDFNLRLFTLSPRHLEACATKTAQILVEGEYNHILKPHLHYIPVTKDFRNLDEALDQINNNTLISRMVDQAYEDIVESQTVDYRKFIQYVLDKSLIQHQLKPKSWHDHHCYVNNLERENQYYKKYIQPILPE